MQLRHLVGLATELVAVFFGFINYRELDKKTVWLFYFTCFAFIVELTINVLTLGFGIENTLNLLHLYVPVEFLLIAIMYFYALKRHFNKKVLLLIIIGFEVYCIINPLFIQGLREYTFARSISSLILILFSILYFNTIMVEARVKKLSQEPMIWINVAVLIYFSGNFFFNILFSPILDYSREFSKITADAFIVMNALFYLLIAIGFWKAGKQKKLY